MIGFGVKMWIVIKYLDCVYRFLFLFRGWFVVYLFRDLEFFWVVVWFFLEKCDNKY